jgi:hypothetical protein
LENAKCLPAVVFYEGEARNVSLAIAHIDHVAEGNGTLIRSHESGSGHVILLDCADYTSSTHGVEE